MKYDKDYFIKKFESIPENEIGKNAIDKHCALWHCGVRSDHGTWIGTEESTALIKLFGGKLANDFEYVYDVNDRLFQSAKKNILEKLYDL